MSGRSDGHAWQRAASFAARAHQHQVRKDGRTPYVAHVFRVAMTVRDAFGFDDPEALAAALLHDTIEDTGTDFDDIEEEFGRAVAELVASLTKNMTLPEREREIEYDARLARADWRARLIKLADLYDNLAELWTPEQRPKMLDKCRRGLALAAGDRATHAETDRASRLLELAMRAE